jgi:chorismate synthase
MLEQADSYRGAGRPSSDRDDHTVVIGGSVARLLLKSTEVAGYSNGA